MAVAGLTLAAMVALAALSLFTSPARANPATGFASVSAGADYTCAVTTGGGVKCWGLNDRGQLGNGTTADSTNPVDVTGLTSGVAAVTTGWKHTCALTTGGGVKCWGSNSQGELGNGTQVDSSTPVDVTGLTSGASAVSAGGEAVYAAGHTCALTTGAGVKCWGRNEGGQLGNGTTTGSTTPVDVTGLTAGAAGVSAAGAITCALTTGGGVKCWGLNSVGSLGDGTSTGPELCTSIVGNLPCSRIPVDVTGLASGVAAVSASAHTCALMVAGGVKCWGWNLFGQLGIGSSSGPETCSFGYPCSTTPVNVTGLAPGVSAVNAGQYGHTCAIAAGGLTCWGNNAIGQLGNGTDTGPETCSFFGNNYTCSSSPIAVTGLASGVSAVGSGVSHTCAVLTAGGGVKCWGSNGHGQLGNGTTNTGSSVPYDVSDKPAPDTDGDACTDPDEQQNLTGSELTGGHRDYLNPDDYFNPSHDGENRIDDVVLVVDQYFIDSGNPGYTADTDRTLAGPFAWNLGPPDGKQRIDDVVNIVKQYFHDCS